MAGAAIVVALGVWFVSASKATPTAPRNVLLITVDTLRADALGAYGNAEAATPWIDRLAAAGSRFDNAHAHSVLTLPSHASILTGRLPVDHGIRDNAGFRLARGEPTLATRLKAQGFQTGAFVSGFPLDSRFGLASGFDVYDDSFVDAARRPAFLEQERAAAGTVAAAQRWLSTQISSPWFCWIHLYDPHYPYVPPEPFSQRFASSPYAGEVAAVDAALRPLLEPVLAAGDASPTLVVFTADHGESLGEHGEATHGIFAYEATLRVPLIVHYPALLPSRVVTASASHVDILPTILGLLNLPTAAARGRSLVDLARGRSTSDEIVYFEAMSGSLNRGWAPLSGVIANGLKYIELPTPELYDLRADPGEMHNLERARQMDSEARRTLLRSFAGAAGDTIRRTAETSEVRARLRALGYVSGDGAQITAGAREDPKNTIATESALQEVTSLYVSGNHTGALQKSRSLVIAHPDMRAALLQLSQLERDAGNLPAAITALGHILELDAGDSEAASLLGATLIAHNRPADAVGLLQPFAAEPEPDVQVLTTLSLALARVGRAGEARLAIDRARSNDPSNALLLVTSGTIELMAGRRTEAKKAFEAALALNPGTARAHSSLGALAAEEGHESEALDHWRTAVAADPAEYDNLFAFALSLARAGRSDAARPYLRMFADGAPASRYAAPIATATEWLRREER